MKQIRFNESLRKSLPHYLATEEWVAKGLPEGEYFFAWQVNPTVICGRHQHMASEIDLEYCRKHGIEVWRRKSGGGCVYADCNNVMFSYITSSDGVQSSFERYTARVCGMLRSLGIEAEPTGRNDIAVAGLKVAGNAYYSLPGRSIVHGTMLYDADFATMGRVLTPSRAKLQAKGVTSVPARVTTLRNCGLSMTCREFIDYATNYLCRSEDIFPSKEDFAAIDKLAEAYSYPDFYNDKTRLCKRGIRVEGAGEIAVDKTVTPAGQIAAIRLSGDFFGTTDLNNRLDEAMTGIPFCKAHIHKALDTICSSGVINGITNETLTNIIMSDL